ncbi:MAG: aminopeptidase [Candidatus Paceibacteria bacterium]|jgi:aminopeptidase
MKQSYKPSEEILAKYAELLVKFGLTTRDGEQLKKGSVVQFTVPEVAKPMYFHLQTAILKCGYQPLGIFLPSNDTEYNFVKNVFDNANKEQLAFYADKYYKGMIDQVDATLYIIAETDPNALAGVDPKKIMTRAAAMKPAKDLKFKKIDAGKMSWSLGLYGTDAAAKEAGMSTKAYWDQIIKACYLDSDNPVAEWKKINKTVQSTAQKLTDLQIKSVHMFGADVDLHVGIGKDRAWRAGGGNNVPSYEVFTSPNFREVNGWIKFNQPLLRYGARIEGIELHFKDGKVTKSSATKNEKVLKEMIKNKGGNQVGEYSLTDARLSRITKFMAETLYDENVGGKFGNSHIALGSAYRDCYVGDPTKVSDKKWEKLGYNDSVVHTDIVTTTDRTVTATLYDGTEKIIYEKGQFTV